MPAKTFDITLPATSANLGPAFDAAALALNLTIRVRAREASEFSIHAEGRDSEVCGKVERHLILETYREVMQAAGLTATPLTLQIENEMPIGKGCGSSAAARLAGIALAVRFGDLDWDDTRIIDEAARREHHPDNAAACWMGGLTVARIPEGSGTQVATFKPKHEWPLLLVIPKATLPTEEARLLLPDRYSRADAVANIQNSLLLLAAFIQDRRDLLRSALQDKIHQPYRAELCPLLPAIASLPENSGVMGAALSGAGPSVLAFLDPDGAPEQVVAVVATHLAKQNLAAELLLTKTYTAGVEGF